MQIPEPGATAPTAPPCPPHPIQLALRAARKAGGAEYRYLLLAWAFVRGMPYRRAERDHRLQTKAGKPVLVRRKGSGVLELFEHNMPSAKTLIEVLGRHLPTWPEHLQTRADRTRAVMRWLLDPRGGVPEIDAALRDRAHTALANEAVVEGPSDALFARRNELITASGRELDELAKGLMLTRASNRRGGLGVGISRSTTACTHDKVPIRGKKRRGRCPDCTSYVGRPPPAAPWLPPMITLRLKGALSPAAIERIRAYLARPAEDYHRVLVLDGDVKVSLVKVPERLPTEGWSPMPFSRAVARTLRGPFAGPALLASAAPFSIGVAAAREASIARAEAMVRELPASGTVTDEGLAAMDAIVAETLPFVPIGPPAPGERNLFDELEDEQQRMLAGLALPPEMVGLPPRQARELRPGEVVVQAARPARGAALFADFSRLLQQVDPPAPPDIRDELDALAVFAFVQLERVRRVVVVVPASVRWRPVFERLLAHGREHHQADQDGPNGIRMPNVWPNVREPSIRVINEGDARSLIGTRVDVVLVSPLVSRRGEWWTLLRERLTEPLDDSAILTWPAAPEASAE